MHLFVNNKIMADPDISDYEFDTDDQLLMPIIIPQFESMQYSYLHYNAILNIKMYSCISLGLKIKQNKIPRNIVEQLWHRNNVTSYEEFPFKMERSDVIWLRVRFNFDRI